MRKDNTIWNFEEKVKKTILSDGMTEQNDRVLAALSGGADSVALLLCLSSLAETLSFSLCACHVNHGIRENAARDEQFCRELCEKYAIPFFVQYTDVPTLAEEWGESLETAARRERYRLLRETSKTQNCTKIATAHTLSDNAETVLLNLCGGCSPDGLCGIPPIRENIIRPLYRLSREEIERYLALRGQMFVTDETNFDESYSRNFLRRRVIPLLKEKNPSLEKALRRLSDDALCDREYFERSLPDPSKNPLSAKEICALPAALARRYIVRLCREEIPNARISAAQTDAVWHILQKGNGTVDLARKRFVLQNGKMKFLAQTENGKTEKKESDSFHIPLKIGQNKIQDDFVIVLSERDENSTPEIPDMLKIENNVYKLYEKIFVHYDIIVPYLYARNRRAEDKIRIGGMNRLLKKVFSSQGIPPEKREKIPIVCDTDGILCVPFFSAPRDGKTVSAEEKALAVSFYAARDFFKE